MSGWGRGDAHTADHVVLVARRPSPPTVRTTARIAVALATAVMSLLTARDAAAIECVRRKNVVVVTSQFAIQVYDALPRPGSDSLAPLEGAKVTVHWKGSRGDSAAAVGNVDATGHLHVVGLPPGEYRAWVALPGFTGREVHFRIVPKTAGPTRLVAVSLEVMMTCGGEVCAVSAGPGPLAKPPACLSSPKTPRHLPRSRPPRIAPALDAPKP